MTDIIYHKAELDFDKFDIKVVEHPNEGFFHFFDNNSRKRIKIVIPAVKKWDISFNFHKKGWWIFGLDSLVDVYLRNVTFILEGVWIISEDGYPTIDADYIDLGLSDSEVQYHDNIFINSFIGWTLPAIDIIMRHAINIFGKPFTNQIVNKILLTHFTDYHYVQERKFLGKDADFALNWAMTKDPHMTKDTITLSFLGQVDVPGTRKSQIPYPDKFKFAERDDYLQVLVTDRVFNTFLETAQEQDLLKFSTTDEVDTIFREFLTGDKRMSVTSGDLSQLLPELQE